MARLNASELAQRLGRQAEAVCRHYLSNGRKQGNYWRVGDVRNTAGRSMFVRLHDSVKGIAGKWQDSATGEYGDLLDVIRDSLGLIDFAAVASGTPGQPGAGVASFPMPIPDDASLAGLSLFTQVLALDPGGPGGVAATSDGLRFQVWGR